MIVAVGALALTATTLLTGCGSKSTTATAASTPAATMPVESAAAESMPAESAAAAAFDPPRPTGFTDTDWADFTARLDPAGARARFEAKTPEEQAKQCKEPYPPSADQLAQASAGLTEQIQGSTVEEWTAVWDYKLAADEASGFVELEAELCAGLS